jgi:hypothetical protein
MHNYKEVVQTYITYNTCFIIALATCLIAPKKIISKVITSIVVYGLKKNVLFEIIIDYRWLVYILYGWKYGDQW